MNKVNIWDFRNSTSKLLQLPTITLLIELTVSWCASTLENKENTSPVIENETSWPVFSKISDPHIQEKIRFIEEIISLKSNFNQLLLTSTQDISETINNITKKIPKILDTHGSFSEYYKLQLLKLDILIKALWEIQKYRETSKAKPKKYEYTTAHIYPTKEKYNLMLSELNLINCAWIKLPWNYCQAYKEINEREKLLEQTKSSDLNSVNIIMPKNSSK